MMRLRAALTFITVAVGASLYGATYVVPPDAALVTKADAIVIARALSSRIEDSKDRGLETVTVFALEDTLKGDVATGFSVRVPGGAIAEKKGPPRFKIVPGAPRFVDGEQVVLFLNRFGNDSYALSDFALGLFGFATDDLGRKVLIRAESEIHGWNVDGSLHREPRREASRFLDYVRDVAAGRPASPDYLIESRLLVGESPSLKATSSKVRQSVSTCSGCTVTQYTLPSGNETSAGFRWKTFPVSWNRGNSAPNAGNGGSDAINTAFVAWSSNSTVNYVLAGTSSNTSGIEESPDGINNIVFEKPLGGTNPFSCTTGGVLGVGGVQNGSGDTPTGDTTNVVNGERFFTTTEGDVSMNLGVNACIGANPGLSLGNFNSAITHEVGHTLGFRHADKSRDNTVPCTNFAAYDCDTSAIMTAIVTSGLNGLLTAWDQRAVSALYPVTAAAAPTGLVATYASGTSVNVTWNAVGGATTYQVHRSTATNASSFSLVCSATAPTTTCTDTTAVAGNAYLYKVRVGTTGTFSTADLATAITFTDASLAGVVVKAQHFNELRSAVNAVQMLAGQATTAYTDPTLSSVVTIKTAHITELRTRLAAARAALAQGALTFTDGSLAGVAIKAVHVTEIRLGVR